MRRGRSSQSARVRGWLAATTAATCLGLLIGPSAVGARGDVRTLDMYNIHTKETLHVTFKKDGVYDPGALKKINHFMRDWRRNESTAMDPELIDLIWELHQELGSVEPVQLISGYRSARTNERLRRRGGGQAKKSQHIQGKAADIHFPDVEVKYLRNSALIREVGGVGYYPRSGIPFVHVDTARVRAWPRVPRQELAMLFPSGKTQHIPADGRPLTAKDGRIAMAKLEARGLTPIQYAHGPHGPATTAIASVEAPTPKSVEVASAPLPTQKPVQEPVQMASAAPEPAPSPTPKAEPSAPFQMANAAPEPAAPARPKPVLASLGPTNLTDTARRVGVGLSWLTRLDEIAAALQPDQSSGFKLPKADPSVTASLAPSPALYRAEVVAPTDELDTEHPEELSYQPYSALPLLADAAAALSTELMGLAHPEQDQVGLLLPEPLPATARFGVHPRSDRFLMQHRFTGPAVAHNMAEAPEASQPDAAAPIRTAMR